MSDVFSDAAIERLVRTFYGRVAGDVLLGPVFARRVQDWEPHLVRMRGFWTAVLRGEPTYHPRPDGTPPELHRALAELSGEHFERWLALFAEVCGEVFEAEAAEAVLARARRMARALSAHLEAEPYRTLRFEPGAIPDGLRTDHALKAGVRGMLRVLAGEPTYVDAAGERTPLRPGDAIAIPPTERHRLDDAEDASVEIALYRVTRSG